MIVFPGTALYHCYRVTDRQNSSDMFSTNMGSTIRGSVRSEISHTKPRYGGNAVFDPHNLAEEKKIMQESQNLGSVEDAR